VAGDPLSLILLPTLACNAACEYCFERHRVGELSLETYGGIRSTVLDGVGERRARTLLIYWQGGEAMLLPPSYYARASDLAQNLAAVLPVFSIFGPRAAWRGA